jgi:serine/threonine protein kinase
LLGKGQYGSIYAVVDKRSQQSYAAKMIKKSSLKAPKLIQSVRQELQILYHLKGRHSRGWLLVTGYW